MCTAHVLMRFCHRVDRSFVCKAKEGRHVRICINIYERFVISYIFNRPVCARIRSKSKNWSNQNNVPEWSDMSTCSLLF
jgi:hypothetical protein